MRHPGRAAALSAFLAVLAGALPARAAPAAFALALDGPASAAHAAYLHAAASGAFAAAGLAVTIRFPADRGAALSALAAGEVDAAVADAISILAARAGGAPLVVVATVGDLHPACLVSRSDAPIASPAGLVGKKVAVDPIGPDRLLLPGWLAGVALRLEDVVMVPLDAAGRAAALGAGTVDASLERIGADRPGFAELPWAAHGFALYGPCLAVRAETLRGRGTVVRSFLKALLKSWETCLEDPAAAAGVAASSGLVPAAGAEAFLASDRFRFDTDAYRKKGLGWIDAARMAATLAEVRAEIGLPVAFAAADAFSTSYLPVPPVLRKAGAADGSGAPAAPPKR